MASKFKNNELSLFISRIRYTSIESVSERIEK